MYDACGLCWGSGTERSTADTSFSFSCLESDWKGVPGAPFSQGLWPVLGRLELLEQAIQETGNRCHFSMG